MIGKIKGKLAEIEGNIGYIETTAGIFYRLFLTPAIISDNPVLSEVEFYTYLQVRDDALVLFGFETKNQYQFFKLLLTVSGVGPKTAYLVISFSKIDELITAIKDNNVDFFTRIPGLGKKTSMKIILELSQKLKAEFVFEKMSLSDDDQTVIAALSSLGFNNNESRKILTRIDKSLSIEEKIKKSIQLLTHK